MENEEYICLLSRDTLLTYLSHRIDDETLSWLIANNKYTVLSDLIVGNGFWDEALDHKLFCLAQLDAYPKV